MVTPTFIALAALLAVTAPLESGRGQHVLTTRILPAQQLTLEARFQYFRANNFLTAGDHHWRQAQELGVYFAPIPFLELYLRERMVLDRNDAFSPVSTFNVGDPRLGAQAAWQMQPNLVAGLSLDVRVPTSAEGSGLATNAVSVSTKATASYRLNETYSLHANAGYVFDHSRKLYAPPRTTLQRFTADISKRNRIVAGISATGNFVPATDITLQPFVELSGAYATGAAGADQPVLATLGTHVLPFGPRSVTLTLGADIRFNGGPDILNPLPGLPPWEAFARISAPFFLDEKPVVTEASTCQATSECKSGLSCEDGACVLVREVVKEVVPAAPAGFFIEGIVTHKITQQPLGGALVKIADTNVSPLTTEPSTGRYRSYLLPSGDGLLQITVSAPGFRDNAQVIARGANGSIQTLSVELVPLEATLEGELKGIIKNATNGRAVAGASVFIVSLNKRVAASSDGSFSIKLAPGTYQIIVEAPKRDLRSQRKQVMVRPGDTVILNIDLSPER